jgi:hypothetical protein
VATPKAAAKCTECTRLLADEPRQLFLLARPDALPHMLYVVCEQSPWLSPGTFRIAMHFATLLKVQLHACSKHVRLKVQLHAWAHCWATLGEGRSRRVEGALVRCWVAQASMAIQRAQYFLVRRMLPGSLHARAGGKLRARGPAARVAVP